MNVYPNSDLAVAWSDGMCAYRLYKLGEIGTPGAHDHAYVPGDEDNRVLVCTRCGEVRRLREDDTWVTDPPAEQSPACTCLACTAPPLVQPPARDIPVTGRAIAGTWYEITPDPRYLQENGGVLPTTSQVTG